MNMKYHIVQWKQHFMVRHPEQLELTIILRIILVALLTTIIFLIIN